jgi:hypothetical protein
MEAPTLWGLVISGVLAIGSVLGVVLSGVGKKQDQEQQQVSDQFKRLLDEVSYWQRTAQTTREEAEGRWDRQIDRCRRITDKLTAALTSVASQANDPAGRKVADEALADLEAHKYNDHGEARP